MNDEDAIDYITQLKGLGIWSAQMFLMFNLNRPDIYPTKDIGLIRAISKNYKTKVSICINQHISIKEILEKLKDDEHYYGEYGRNFISNSDIRTLMTNPLEFKKPTPSAPHFLIGGYFHTAILEPDKIKNFKIVEASSRNTKAYKEITNGEVCLLQHEVDKVEGIRTS